MKGKLLAVSAFAIPPALALAQAGGAGTWGQEEPGPGAQDRGLAAQGLAEPAPWEVARAPTSSEPQAAALGP
jgi:hypothetical protein